MKLFLTKFTDESITISSSVLLFVLVGIITYWLYNRRKFQKLSHQIPASVVKNYLDSIIQNSTALKSSLFRGGGLELGEGIPSVVPVSDLSAGNVSASGVSDEVLNQKNAEINSLKASVEEKNRIIADLENQLANIPAGGGGDSEAKIKSLNEEIAILKAELEKRQKELESAQASGGGADEVLQENLEKVTSERDELKERLMEYEIIEEDLANLKRLQQENVQLKMSLKELGEGGDSLVSTSEEAAAKVAGPSPEPESKKEDNQQEDSAIDDMDMSALMGKPFAEGELPPKEEAQAEEANDESGDDLGVPEAPEGEQKSAEELLSEFEKMLG